MCPSRKIPDSVTTVSFRILANSSYSNRSVIWRMQSVVRQASIINQAKYTFCRRRTVCVRMHSGVSNSSTVYVRFNRFSGVRNVLQFLNTLCSDVCVCVCVCLYSHVFISHYDESCFQAIDRKRNRRQGWKFNTHFTGFWYNAVASVRLKGKHVQWMIGCRITFFSFCLFSWR
jgi:hypothetical protein